MYDNDIYSNHDNGNFESGIPVNGNAENAAPVNGTPETVNIQTSGFGIESNETQQPQPQVQTWGYSESRQPQQTQQTWQSTEPQQTQQTWQPTEPQQQTYQTYQTYQPTAQTAQPQKKSDGKKSGFFSKILVSVSLGLLFGIFAGIGFFAVQQGMNAAQKAEAPKTTEIKEAPEIKSPNVTENKEQPAQPATSQVIYTGSANDVSDIVDAVMPAMVSIVNNYTQRTTFWGQVYEEPLSSSGSGIIVGQTDTELLIVSNHHVVADAEELLVTLIDGTEVEARIKGMDSEMDLAVIAIDLNDLSTETKNAIVVATLGNSDTLRMGQCVIAIGNALGYGQSTTVGYISALNREIELEDGSVKSFIQTDAAINPGNSGGALLNMAGEVIGINSNKIGGSSIEGMGYAIPITTASPIIADLMERQTRNKVASSKAGFIGISYKEVTDQFAEMFGMPKGVYVTAVLEGTGAEAAGILQGDVLVKFDGEKIASYADLQSVLQYYASGDTVMVSVMRLENGEYVECELSLTLGKRPN